MFQDNKGFTLIETLVGVSILILVFTGIYGAFQFGLKVIGQNKARVTATALANQKIENVRNLPYQQIGTLGGIPPGDIPETETVNRNNLDFTVKTTIGYQDDPFDGLAPIDPLPNDYKKVKVKVSWPGFLGGEVVLISDVAPRGLETFEGGGNLLISAFDALGQPVVQANIHLINTALNPPIDTNYQTNDQGQYLVAGAPSSTNAYQISLTKSGFSSDRTYGTEEVANPNKPHTSVVEGKLTEISFSIDKLSSFLIKTLSPWGSDDFADSFLDQTKISQSEDLIIDQGEVGLATSSQGYLVSGHFFSIPIEPTDLINWAELSWDDNQPEQTKATYQLFYSTNTSWWLIPDADLIGNEAGLESEPIDLSGLSVADYPKLKIKGSLSTNNTSTTPLIYDWTVSWITQEATPIGNISFNLQGNKKTGTDADEEPVYKYSNDFTSGADGQINLNNLEWDLYDFTIDPAENLDLISTNPESDPLGQNIDLFPDSNQDVELYLDAENSLLVDLQNNETTEPIFNASVRLTQSGFGYDQTQFTNQDGQTLFIPLEIATYQAQIQADGYQSYSGNISISGDDTLNINLTPLGPS